MLDVVYEKNITIATFKNVTKFNYIISQTVKDDLNSIMKKPGAKLILDCKGIEFLDSSAIGALISVVKAAKEFSGKFYLCNISAEVMDLFEVMQLTSVFDVFSTKEDAISKL